MPTRPIYPGGFTESFSIREGLTVGACGQESEKPFQSWTGIRVDVLGHLVIHEGKILVTDDAAAIAHLSDVADVVAPIGHTSMPHLVVENDNASGTTETGSRPFRPLGIIRVFGTRFPDEVGAANTFGGAVSRFGHIREIVVGREEKAGKTDVFGRIPVRYDVMRWIVLVPRTYPSPRRAFEGVVMHDVAVLAQHGFGEVHDRFKIKQTQVGSADFEHPKVETNSGG